MRDDEYVDQSTIEYTAGDGDYGARTRVAQSTDYFDCELSTWRYRWFNGQDSGNPARKIFGHVCSGWE